MRKFLILLLLICSVQVLLTSPLRASAAGRDFDGTNDKIDYGSDASVDGFVVKSIAAWMIDDATTGGRIILGKAIGPTHWMFSAQGASNSVRQLRFTEDFTTTDGAWLTTAGTIVPGQRHHVALVYDNSSVANDPDIYIDGVLQSETESATPTLTANTDAAVSLLQGEDSSGTNDFDGQMGWINYHNAAFSAADVNRAMWWGRPYGGLIVYHPLTSESLANKGTATAAGTATGTTVASLAAPVVRPGTTMLGMGVGW